MKLNNFWGNSRSPGMQVGVIVRLGFALTAIVGSIALAWVLLGGHNVARASSLNSINTAAKPMGMVIANGNVWVAEPNCLANPVCTTPPKGAIEEFKLNGSGGLTLVNTYQPAAQYNPIFLQVDSGGNVWFTDPTNNLIGELIPGSHTWKSFTTGLSTGAEPYGIVIDKNGKIWFAERGISKIGFLDPAATTPTIKENGGFTANSQPFGMTLDGSGNVWFTEDTVAKLGTFAPTTNGTVTTITEHSTGAGVNAFAAHMITYDGKGDLWYSGGPTTAVGEYTISSGATQFFDLVSSVCPTNCTNVYINGIATDSVGNVWFDETQNVSIGGSQFPVFGSLNPTTQAVNLIPLPQGSGPGEGLVADSANNIWVSMLYGSLVDEQPAGAATTPTPTGGSPTASPSPTPNLPPGPVFKTWYFAEGHIGASFQEYLTVQNPDPLNSCAVTFQYLLSSGNPVSVPVTVGPNTRWTENVNQDLGVSRIGSFAEDVSTIVTVNNATTPNCTGVVGERPMYFTNLFGASSGHDALGATHLGTSFYFPDVASFTGFRDFITILNPTGGSAANITATYYQGGTVQGTDTLTVQPGTRGTISPKNCGCTTGIHVSALVTSSQAVDVELPTYFTGFQAGNAGAVSGAAVVVGAPATSNDWRFAEGYIGGKFQEDIRISNFGTGATPVTTTMVLEYDTGTTLTVPVSVGSQDTALEDINYITAHASSVGTCSSPCNLSQNISVEITAPGGSKIVAERELYFQYSHVANGRTLNATGGTAVIGQSGTATTTSYSFAEGYTNYSYDEWLSIQNPTNKAETIWVTIVNGNGQKYAFSVPVGATTRATVDLVKMVLSSGLCTPGASSQCWEISMTVQTINSGGPFLAERPMYFNASGSQGGTVVIGYVGG